MLHLNVSKLKKEFLVQKFDKDAEVRSIVQQFFKTIPEDEFKKTIYIKWPERMGQCIYADSQYFEKRLEHPNLSHYDGDLSASD